MQQRLFIWVKRDQVQCSDLKTNYFNILNYFTAEGKLKTCCITFTSSICFACLHLQVKPQFKSSFERMYVKPHLELNIESISHHNLLHSCVKENVNKARQTDERICNFSLILEAEESLSLSSSSSGRGLFLKFNVYVTEPAKRTGLIIYFYSICVIISYFNSTF